MTVEQAARRQITVKKTTLINKKNPALTSCSEMPVIMPTSESRIPSHQLFQPHTQVHGAWGSSLRSQRPHSGQCLVQTWRGGGQIRANPSRIRRRCGRCVPICTLPVLHALHRFRGHQRPVRRPDASASCEGMRNRFIAGLAWAEASLLAKDKSTPRRRGIYPFEGGLRQRAHNGSGFSNPTRR